MSDITRDTSFGGWLRYYRIERKITLRSMCEKLKMDAGNYSRIERSLADPPSSQKRVWKLLKPLNLVPTQVSFMTDMAFQHHLAKFRERWRA
jgi:transcriptional regulator with XRE-family HTH domain